MANYTAGQKLSATDMNNNISKYLGAHGTTTSATTTTSTADLDGCTLTFTTAEANTRVMVVGTFDFQINGATDIAIGVLDVDGSEVTGETAIANGTIRVTVAQTWLRTLAAAGSHTLKLRHRKTGSSNTVTVRAAGSSLVVAGNGLT